VRQDYFFLIFARGNDLGASDSLFISCVSGLVRESREFGMLLGRIDPQTGQKKSGAIDKVIYHLLIFQASKTKYNNN